MQKLRHHVIQPVCLVNNESPDARERAGVQCEKSMILTRCAPGCMLATFSYFLSPCKGIHPDTHSLEISGQHGRQQNIQHGYQDRLVDTNYTPP